MAQNQRVSKATESTRNELTDGCRDDNHRHDNSCQGLPFRDFSISRLLSDTPPVGCQQGQVQGRETGAGHVTSGYSNSSPGCHPCLAIWLPWLAHHQQCLTTGMVRQYVVCRLFATCMYCGQTMQRPAARIYRLDVYC